MARSAGGARGAGHAVAAPEIVAAPPGDRRFAAREWSELPYLSLLKQATCSRARYLTELAALAPLPDRQAARSRS